MKRFAGHGEWDDETTRRWMERLKTQLEAFGGNIPADSGPRKSSGNQVTVVPPITHDSLDGSAEGPDVDPAVVGSDVDPAGVGPDVDAAAKRPDVDAVAKRPDLDPVAITLTPAGVGLDLDESRVECDENDDLQTRLQTLADETTGITDVSIASFVSDASDTSAFRPLRQGRKSRCSHRKTDAHLLI